MCTLHVSLHCPWPPQQGVFVKPCSALGTTVPTHCCHGANPLLPWYQHTVAMVPNISDVGHRTARRAPPAGPAAEFFILLVSTSAHYEDSVQGMGTRRRHEGRGTRHDGRETRHEGRETGETAKTKTPSCILATTTWGTREPVAFSHYMCSCRSALCQSRIQSHREPVAFSHYMCSCRSALCQSRIQSPLSSSLPMILVTLRAHSTPRLHIHSCSFQTR